MGHLGVAMKRAVRIPFWFQTGLALLSGSVAIITLFRRDWIEALIGVDPDYHNGSLESAIIAALAVVSIAFALTARTEWRRPRALGEMSSM
jgi:hypothetical protein